MTALEDRHWWFVARRRILSEALTRCIDLPASAGILEAGCGTGGNLPMPARLGRVSAIEPNAEVRTLAALLNRLLTAVFASERWLIGRVTLPFGLPILMICRKRPAA